MALKFVLLLAVVAAVAAVGAADILYKECEAPADHPSIKDGNFYNLCIQEHEFEDEAWAWTLTNTTIKDTKFDRCTFENNKEKTSNFTETTFETVKFHQCEFGSHTNEPLLFNKMAMRNVEFTECRFDKSADLLFEEFDFTNVTFTDCKFQGDTLFKLGQLTDVTFDGCTFKHSDEAETVSGKDSIRFHQTTIREASFIDSEFVAPLRFEGAQIANMAFNDTSINQFWCHDEPDAEGKYKYYTSFNDSTFQTITFADKVYCDQVTWRGMFMGNITFLNDADFSRSDVLNMYWDEVEMKAPDKSCGILDFSKSVIKRRVLANTTIACKADFSDTTFETVFVKNFVAKRPNFKNAVFSEQEFIDSNCCSRACISLKCWCNVTTPSGECPIGGKNVNKTAVSLSCFPGTSTLALESGLTVRMEDLDLSHKVAVGGGEHSDIYFFGHRSAGQLGEFVSISHATSATPVRLSESHYLYVNGELRTAGSVRMGDRLRSASGADDLVVLNVERETLRGLYAPTSMHGDLLVDGVVVSSYTDVIHPHLAHRLLHPLRLLYRYGMTGLVQRFTALHERSWAFAPRALGLPRGPTVVRA